MSPQDRAGHALGSRTLRAWDSSPSLALALLRGFLAPPLEEDWV